MRGKKKDKRQAYTFEGKRIYFRFSSICIMVLREKKHNFEKREEENNIIFFGKYITLHSVCVFFNVSYNSF